jgi:hypothetical protein
MYRSGRGMPDRLALLGRLGPRPVLRQLPSRDTGSAWSAADSEARMRPRYGNGRGHAHREDAQDARVGEQVNLSSNGTWTVTGDGKFDRTDPATDVRFTAGDVPGIAIVTASGRDCLDASITFFIIKPTNLYYAAFGGVKHTMGLSDIGIQTNFYLLPATVSFANLTFLESDDTTMVADGVWACGNGQHGHNANQIPVQVGDNVPGVGSPVGTDEAYFGNCDGANQLAAGSASITIPDIYYGPGGGSNQFASTAQVATADGRGNLSMAKGGASRATTVNSRTSDY